MAIFFVAVLLVGGYLAMISDGTLMRYFAMVAFISGIPGYWATLRLANFYEGPGHHSNKVGHTLVYLVFIIPGVWLALELAMREGGDPSAIIALILFAMSVSALTFGFAVIDRHRYLELKERGDL